MVFVSSIEHSKLKLDKQINKTCLTGKILYYSQNKYRILRNVQLLLNVLRGSF